MILIIYIYNASRKGGDVYSIEQYSRDASHTSSRHSESSRITYNEGRTSWVSSPPLATAETLETK